MNSSRFVRRALTLVGVMGNQAWSLAQATTSAPASPDLPEVSFSVLRVLGALALVLAVFFGGVWLFRNWQRFARPHGKSPKLNVLEVKSLGNRQALYVVSYERQRLLLASSTAGVTLVSHLPEADASEPEETSSPPAFTEALQRVLSRKP